jgi:hypothetical protein
MYKSIPDGFKKIMAQEGLKGFTHVSQTRPSYLLAAACELHWLAETSPVCAGCAGSCADQRIFGLNEALI